MILDWVSGHAVRRPDAMAIADDQGALTWRELLDHALAQAARYGGPQSGEQDPHLVALHGPADCAWVIAFLALEKRRHPVVALPQSLPSAAADQTAAALGASTLIRSGVAVRLNPGSAPLPRPGTVLVHLTSGSTGTARGVLRGAINLDDEAATVARALRLGDGKPVLMGTPVSHSFCSGLLLAALRAGAPSIIVPRYDPASLVRLMVEYRPGTIAGTPYIFRSVTRAVRGNARGLDVALCGGSALPSSWARDWLAASGVAISQEYGLSESGIVAMNLGAAADAPGSVGVPLDGVRVHVVDDADQAVPAGTEGHLVVAREGSPSHYIGDAGQVTPIPARGDGLLRGVDTGDLARFDERGLLYITGRSKLMINVGGAKVNPVEVEGHLVNHARVRDAIVVGLPDEYRGEVVGAVVEVAPGTTITDLSRHLRQRVSSYAVPRTWRFVEAVPRTAAGKQDRLRALAILEGR